MREVLEEADGVEVRAWVDELCADHRREVRVAPRVRVEHRHYRQDRVVHGRTEPERVVRGDAERMQHARPVRIDDTLRQTGRPARVAHRGGVVLVDVRLAPVVRGRAGEQLFVRVLDDEHVLDLRAVAKLFEQRHERTIDDDGLVAAVVRDVREIVRVQAEIQRVEHEAAARDAEVRLMMLHVVPAERPDAIALLQAELLQRDGELLRPAHRVRVRRAVERLVR